MSDLRKLAAALLIIALPGCNITSNQPDLEGLDVRVTFIHTSDIHSRLLPYKLKVPLTDQNLGLLDENAPFGGAARMSHIIHREREHADRSLYVETGDVFQGAPIFNLFHGEAEFKALSLMGVDVMAIGNHEFDQGEPNIADKIARYASFPILAANYKFTQPPPPLADLLNDYEIFNLKGLRIGVIGLANTSSMSTLIGAGNKLGITPLHPAETTQFLIDFIQPMVDVIVVASHLGMTGDEWLIRNTSGIDVLLGGHHHIVLSPPKSTILDCQTHLMDPQWRERFLLNHMCTPREVVLVHSGAFAKYVGRLDAVFAQKDPGGSDWEVKSYKYKAIPVDSTIPEDDRVKEMLEPYVDKMNQVMQLDLVLGYAPIKVTRFGSQGGDSELGNLVSDSMRLRKGVETDFALTNTLGIRTDISPGPVTVDDMYNVFPFENTLTTMYLSGSEVVELFDYVARRTASRGCKAQAQISGARAVLQCGRCDLDARPAEWQAQGQIAVTEDAEGCALSIEILGQPVSLDGQYQLAANNYIAKGGSGFNVLKRNTTQIDTGIPQREALMDHMRQGGPCGSRSACTRDADCGNDDYACGCEERSEWNAVTGTCDRAMECPLGGGMCVLASCIDDVGDLFVEDCVDVASEFEPYSRCQCEQRARAMAQCDMTACIDDTNGAVEDGRLQVIPP
ncbi:MAG: bifunctional metallophosphatase/5'-nucleotidase [Deltaproteobacteria bacterium]|nr:bifunctional metallophosphatase/5'-nucleotidase [Deltaproteobacteria bacterium]